MIKITFLEDEPIVLAGLALKISQTPFEKGNIEELHKECRNNKDEVKKISK